MLSNDPADIVETENVELTLTFRLCIVSQSFLLGFIS